MKFNFDSLSVRNDRKKQWHTWFAWYPVRINSNQIVWLESLQRRGIFVDRPQEHPYWKWFYKPKDRK